MPYRAKGRKKDFPVFDCDSHVFEPPDVWDQYIPSSQREFAKTHLYVNTDRGMRVLNGRVSFQDPRSNGFAAEVWNPTLTKEEIGAISPASDEWDEKIGRNAITRDPYARLKDMDASGIDQVMVFPSSPMITLPLVKNIEAARLCARAYNDWASDYCSVSPRRLFPCAILPTRNVDFAIEELRRVAKLGFKAAFVRPILVDDKYPTFPEYDPLWREFEDLGMALGMHHFIAPGAMTQGLERRVAEIRGVGFGAGFAPEPQLYSPGQFVPNITSAMGSISPSGEVVSFLAEAINWTTIVLITGWLEKFPRLRVAVLEANASWLPLILEKCEGYLKLNRYVLDAANPPVQIGDPWEVFNRQCYIAFESDEDTVFRMWDLYEDIALWSSDMPHHDAADVWEAIDGMAKRGVPESAQAKMLGGNARRLYGIEPELFVTEAPDEYQPTKLPRFVS
jgi:predicted TIM-barrel fold metal-dependent hydrolase